MKFARLSGLVFICFIFLIISPPDLQGQEVVKKLTLKDAIEIAKKQSPDALMAKHKFRASYWQYKSFQASYLPSLLLTGALPASINPLIKYRLQKEMYFPVHNN